MATQAAGPSPRTTLDRWFGRLAVGVAALTAVVCVASWWAMESLPVDMEQWELVVPGATELEVRRLLGEPQLVADDGAVWIYGHSWKWISAKVYFDRTQRVARTEIDR